LLRFGGCQYNYFGDCRQTNELWSLSLRGAGTWERVIPEGDTPPQMIMHSAVVDERRHRMVVSGGQQSLSYGHPIEPETWALSLDGSPRWTKLSIAGPPGLSVGDFAAYDRARDRILDFSFQQGPRPLVELSLHDNHISVLSPEGRQPKDRLYRLMEFDTKMARLLVLGGYLDAYEHRQDVMFVQFTHCRCEDRSGSQPTAGELAANAGKLAISASARGRAEAMLSVATTEPVTIEWFDIAGRKLSREIIEHPPSGGDRAIGLRTTSRLANGVYFVRATQGTSSAHAKIVLMR
jgi:hypothetical protein